MAFVTMRAAFFTGLLLSGVLLGTPIASAAPPRPLAEVTFEGALAQVATDAQRVQANSRQIQLIVAPAKEHLQSGTAALQNLKAGHPPVNYVRIYAARDELQAALEAFERISDLLDDIYVTLGAMQGAIDQAKMRASAVPSEKGKLEHAEKLLASALLVGQEATSSVLSEISSGRDAAKTYLVELDLLDKEKQKANAQRSDCDIHRERYFNYPRSIELWYPNPRNPIFDPPPANAYTLHSQAYADLNGNGRIEAIVQLRQPFFNTGAGDCSSQGQGWIFVFEMDAKCVVHRLAQIKGTACDRLRILSKTLLIDQPRLTPNRSSADEPVCEHPPIRRFVWQFKFGTLRSTFTDLCTQTASN